jgi:Fur family peroxide stress response transcriptional regulator
MNKYDLFITKLQQSGYRLTAQRRAVCAYLATTEKHPTPSQVYEEVRIAQPEISRATVYNTLKTLQQLGAIVEVSLGAEHTHYDTDPAPHVNLICLRCHTIEDYHGVLLMESLHEEVQNEFGFQPVTTRIDLHGFCHACRKQRKAEIIAQWGATHEVEASHPRAAAHAPLDQVPAQQDRDQKKDQSA